MNVEKIVKHVQKKLNKLISEGKNEKAVLHQLKKLVTLPVDLEVLTKTRIGQTINSLRKSSKNEEIIVLSKSLIKTWKNSIGVPIKNETPELGNVESAEPKILEPAKPKVAEPAKPTVAEPADTKQVEPDEPEKMECDIVQKVKPVNVKVRQDSRKKIMFRKNRTVSFPSNNTTADLVRSKSRELLTAAIRQARNDFEGLASPEDLAGELEHFIFNEFKNTDTRYKNRVRSRISNLKDAKNTYLKNNFISGALPAAKLAVMTSQEIAADEMKKLYDCFVRCEIGNVQLTATSGVKTDLLTCGKCRQNNCTYDQRKVERTDEQMTTFIKCNVCGNKWQYC